MRISKVKIKSSCADCKEPDLFDEVYSIVFENQQVIFLCDKCFKFFRLKMNQKGRTNKDIKEL